MIIGKKNYDNMAGCVIEELCLKGKGVQQKKLNRKEGGEERSYQKQVQYKTYN